MKYHRAVFLRVLFIIFIGIVLFCTSSFAPRQRATAIASYPANIEYDPGGYGKYNQAALINPNIGAVDINMNWYQVEPQQGVFNFDPADQELAAWAAQGKKVTLELRFQHEASFSSQTTGCTNNGWLPDWEVTRIPTFCDTDMGLIMPDYFDPTFKADWKTYVQAVATHYANSSYKNAIIYVRTAIGLGAEAILVMGCPASSCDIMTDKQHYVSWGYTPQTWEAWQEEMMGFYKNAFPYTTVIYPIIKQDVNPTTGNPVQVDVAYWAASQGIGVGQQGLMPNYPTDYANIKEILTTIRSRYPSTYIQFQTWQDMNTSATQLPGCDATCVLQGDISTANQLGAQSIEWYSDDDINPAFQPYFTQWQQTVNSKFGGGSNTPAPTNVTPVPTGTPPLTVSPSPTQPSSALFLIVCLHGLGNCGDNANPSSGGNTAPLHTQRVVTMSFIAATTAPEATSHATIIYNPQARNFQATVFIPQLPNGAYVLTIQSDGYLAKQIPGIVTVTQGQHVTLPEVSLTTGDVNNDNQLDIIDYNIILSCFGTKYTTSSCLAPNTTSSPGADLDDDSTVDGADYNLFIRELSVQRGN